MSWLYIIQSTLLCGNGDRYNVMYTHTHNMNIYVESDKYIECAKTVCVVFVGCVSVVAVLASRGKACDVKGCLSCAETSCLT